VDNLIRKYAKQSDIKKKVNAQVLRNTFAVRLLKTDISQKDAIKILGLTDPDSLKRYSNIAKGMDTESIIDQNQNKSTPQLQPPSLLQKLFPTKPTTSKVLPTKPELVEPDPETTIFGRDHIIEEIKTSLTKTQSILVTGEAGMGKTHLLKHIAKQFEENALYLESPTPIKTLLTQIANKVVPNWKSELPTRPATTDILNCLTNRQLLSPPVIIIDNLTKLKSSDSDVIIQLLKIVTILASTETLTPKLKSLWWKFKQIDLPPLTEKSSKVLIKHLTQHLSITDYEMMETRLLTLSNGIPVSMVETVRQLGYKNVVTCQSIRDVYHDAGVKYRDWSYGIIILWALLVMSRFIALGTHSFEGYILAGFGTSLILVSKFFLFKMR